jgi:hypothetical protein
MVGDADTLWAKNHLSPKGYLFRRFAFVKTPIHESPFTNHESW